MKRGLFTVLGILIACMAAAVLAFYFFHTRQPATAWLQKEFSLSNDQAQRIEIMHREYGKSCMQMCAQIQQSDTHLAELLQKSDRVTPEILVALAEADRVRTVCRAGMLGHFYQVAAVMPEGERQRYLKMVFPLIQHPEKMGAYQLSLRGR